MALGGDPDNPLTLGRNGIKPRYVNDLECNHVVRVCPAITPRSWRSSSPNPFPGVDPAWI